MQSLISIEFLLNSLKTERNHKVYRGHFYQHDFTLFYQFVSILWAVDVNYVVVHCIVTLYTMNFGHI